MYTKYKVADVTCVDVDGKMKGIHIACGEDGRSCVTLYFDDSIPHKQTDELARQLRNMKLNLVTVET